MALMTMAWMKCNNINSIIKIKGIREFLTQSVII